MCNINEIYATTYHKMNRHKTKLNIQVRASESNGQTDKKRTNTHTNQT